jgi:RNA polymerase-binding transcription factor DksA
MTSSLLPQPALDELRSVLEERYLATVHRSTCLFDEAMRQLAADGSSDDAGSTAQRTAQAAKEAALEARLVDEALVRMAAGTYGSCDECGRVISLDRLRVHPVARWCGDCDGAIP